MTLVDPSVHPVDIGVSRPLRGLLCFALAGLSLVTLRAQTIDDALMMPTKTLFAGYLFTHDSWNHYWEGTFKRVNGNIGTITTETSTFTANYGLTDRLNLIANVPYVSTNASQGVLAGQSGWQDATFAAKYRVITRPITDSTSVSLFGVAFGGFPMTNYTPDFQPLSLGLASRRLGGRMTVNFQTQTGWFLYGTSAYTWRGNVSLDRPYYFTENQLFLTNIVQMPDVVDYTVSPGFLRKGTMIQGLFTKFITQGGGDIRPQDMPFVSNRFISSKIGMVAMYPLPIPKLKTLSLRLELGRIIDGRNVGQSTTVTVGLFETLSFKRRITP